ncbi:hypothetical protein PanWU01x14_152580 [Parasponia andersonii]|uniref:Uncharacterized protein n=1 Tax=Parasponia andersonii TaxID=3476 RepID=A0A2P5CHE1_PARAD|nr:hypothetical protein PanWU01x14_152580 [Parasponia andersonii]
MTTFTILLRLLDLQPICPDPTPQFLQKPLTRARTPRRICRRVGQIRTLRRLATSETLSKHRNPFQETQPLRWLQQERIKQIQKPTRKHKNLPDFAEDLYGLDRGSADWNGTEEGKVFGNRMRLGSIGRGWGIGFCGE